MTDFILATVALVVICGAAIDWLRHPARFPIST